MSEEKIESRWFDGEEYLNITNAARYMGISGTGLHNIIKRVKNTERALPVWQLPGGRNKYIKRSDIDNYMKPQRAN
jgi:hypothetical protein